MSRLKLAKSLGTNLGIPKHIARQVVDSTLDEITNTLGSTERYVLKGFGSFSIKVKPARQVRNPRTGNYSTKNESLKLSFHPSEQLIETLQSKIRETRGHRKL